VKPLSQVLVLPLLLIALAFWLASLLLAGGCTKTVIQQVMVTAIPETSATRSQPTTAEHVQTTTYEITTTAALWSDSTSLTFELEGLLEPDNSSSSGDATLYAVGVVGGCMVAKEDVPGLWTYVSDGCEALEAAGPEGILGQIDGGDYEQAHRLAEAVNDASLEYLLRLGGLDTLTDELYITANLAAHAGMLGSELKNLSSNSDDSPSAAAFYLPSVVVDCEMAKDSPSLWSSVADNCKSVTMGSPPNLAVLIDSGRYDEAFRQVARLSDEANRHLFRLMHFEL